MWKYFVACSVLENVSLITMKSLKNDCDETVWFYYCVDNSTGKVTKVESHR